ncbi:hypothetical protein GW17_00048927 [Ensete ventricosum]|nr:hypothetical protein GW17_00048927 [Ensete ventricosum]
MFKARFAISTCTARYGRYISVRQVIGTRTARYRAVPSKIGRRRPILKEIDRRRSIEEEEEEKEKKKKRGRKNTSPAPSSPACRRRSRVARDRGRFFSRARRRDPRAATAVGFTGNYNEYFGYATDVDAVVYLMLVNDMIHGLYPEAVTIGEDVMLKTHCSMSDER